MNNTGLFTASMPQCSCVANIPTAISTDPNRQWLSMQKGLLYLAFVCSIDGATFTVQLPHLWQIRVLTEVLTELMVWQMARNVLPLKWLMDLVNLKQVTKVKTTVFIVEFVVK